MAREVKKVNERGKTKVNERGQESKMKVQVSKVNSQSGVWTNR